MTHNLTQPHHTLPLDNMPVTCTASCQMSTTPYTRPMKACCTKLPPLVIPSPSLAPSNKYLVRGKGTRDQPLKIIDLYSDSNVTLIKREPSYEIPEPPPPVQPTPKVRKLTTPPYFPHDSNNQPCLNNLVTLAALTSQFSAEYQYMTLKDILWMAVATYTMQEDKELADDKIKEQFRLQWRQPWVDRVNSLGH